MSKASIYDRLQRRPPAPVETPKVSTERSDFRRDRLRVIDGVALTPAGLVNAREIPPQAAPEVSPTLEGAGGSRLLIHPIVEGVGQQAPDPMDPEAKAQRVHQLIEAVALEAMMMLDNAEPRPAEVGFDIVLSAPLRSATAWNTIIEPLRKMIQASPYGQGLGSLRHTENGWDMHRHLSVPDTGGRPYVVWISADSLINRADVGRLQQHALLAGPSTPNGMKVGEACAALLLQRVAEDTPNPATGWWLDEASVKSHPKRDDLHQRTRHANLVELLASALADTTPDVLISDSLRRPGRATEVSRALLERGVSLDIIDDGISVEEWCGWPGEALTALQLVLAVASLAKMPEQDALMLNVAEEERSRAMVLHSTSGTDSSSQEAAVAASADTRIGS
ncbi:hypothetical protein ACUN9Y_05640 [Halomonas sp. V046]|uniref:hypothetical protein n=1 Tax=Halomonas sp. V046 TaxID=3459611 RepID=UPI004044DECD